MTWRDFDKLYEEESSLVTHLFVRLQHKNTNALQARWNILGQLGFFPTKFYREGDSFDTFDGGKCAKKCFVIVFLLSYDIDRFEVTGPNQV